MEKKNIFVFAFFSFFACGKAFEGGEKKNQVAPLNFSCETSLVEVKSTLLGVCATSQQVQDPFFLPAISQYKMITPEYQFKMNVIVPKDGVYDWTASDALYEYAEKNHVGLFGHALVWYRSNPTWLYQYKNAPIILDKKVKDYWEKIVSRYPNVLAWDVINEAVEEDHYRNELMYNAFSEKYIETAFRYVHAINPTALLFYNDYDLEKSSKKRAFTQAMIRNLLRKKVPIHGIGLQFHWGLDFPNLDEVNVALTEITQLGLKIHFSEIDVRLNMEGKKDFVPSSEELLQQAAIYKKIGQLFMSIPADLQYGITFWGVTDETSWIPGETGNPDAPTMFFSSQSPKPAYFSFLQQINPASCEKEKTLL